MAFHSAYGESEASVALGADTGPRRSANKIDRALARVGDWLLHRQTAIRRMQWIVVGAYVALLCLPAVLPLPPSAAHIWTNVTLFAQFVFWGLWWPFVLLSMVLVGRVWCGLLCPEGALSEIASEHGRGGSMPRWLQWKGWPFVAFVLTTIYGQMVSVYQYPRPALVILGGSTVAAIGVGYLYGRNKRVWCRFLCPVTGVFTVLAKLAPLHFRVDRQAWASWERSPGAPPQEMNCAPLVPVKIMRGGGACHMCGRCSGYRGAVTLARRSPSDEIVHVAGDMPNKWQTALILFGMLGVAAGAFHWTSSATYVAVRQTLAEWVVNHDVLWPVEPILPWFVLTNYPELNDTMTPLDGLVLIGYILTTACLVATGVGACLAVATRLCGPWSWPRFHHFVQAMIPVAGCGVFLGLSSLTLSMLKTEGVTFWFTGFARASMLAGAGVWAVWLGWRIAKVYAGSTTWRPVAALVPMATAVAIGGYTWATLFWRI
jgi:polyferredoxin